MKHNASLYPGEESPMFIIDGAKLLSKKCHSNGWGNYLMIDQDYRSGEWD